MRVVIVSRHEATIRWLREKANIRLGKVIPHVSDPSEIDGAIVIGNIPLHLAARAQQVWAVEIPNLPPEKRGADLTVEELEQYGAYIAPYVVRRSETVEEICPRLFEVK